MTIAIDSTSANQWPDPPAASPPEQLLTPEDLLRLPDAKDYELVDGKLVERNMGMECSEIIARILALLWNFVSERRLGKMFASDGGYQCFPGAPDKVRKPDASFIRAGRLPDDKTPKGYCHIPPDLAIEVVSPNDLAHEVHRKVQEYLDAGVPLIWVVYPENKSVMIFRRSHSPLGSISELRNDQTITGEEILPEFSCSIERFFND